MALCRVRTDIFMNEAKKNVDFLCISEKNVVALVDDRVK